MTHSNCHRFWFYCGSDLGLFLLRSDRGLRIYCGSVPIGPRQGPWDPQLTSAKDRLLLLPSAVAGCNCRSSSLPSPLLKLPMASVSPARVAKRAPNLGARCH